MAAHRLALLPTHAPPAAAAMWYAHNYAQRRTQARNFSRSFYAHDYSHDMATPGEYAHASAPVLYAHNPYHVCQDRAFAHAAFADAEYPGAHREYAAEYAHANAQTHAHIANHSHNASYAHTTAHVHAANHAHATSHAHSAGHAHAAHIPAQNPAHLSDVEVSRHYSAPTYAQEWQFGREEPARARSAGARRHEQASRVRPHVQERARQRAQSQTARARAAESCAFYAESPRSSPEEEEEEEEGGESVLEGDVRVDLPYTHSQCRGRAGGARAGRGRDAHAHSRSEHIIRRFEDTGEACEEDGEVSTVGLSYQQRADACISQGHHRASVGAGEGSEGESDGRRGGLLLREGLVREWVRAVGVVAASGTLVTLVVLGFGVYNMLITTLFLLFVLTTVALLIFLLMRRPPCCPCCQDPYDSSSTSGRGDGSQGAHIPYLTETHGIVVKKWMKDSPPPYESPPEYSSLSPELIMDAKTLQELVNASQTSSSQSQGIPVGVHNSHHSQTSSASCQGRSASPLCTTPLFSSANFCDTPRSLTPTGTLQELGKARAGVYDRPPSPIFTSCQYQLSSSSANVLHLPASNAFVASPPTTAASDTVPSSAYAQHVPPPPTYESLRIHSHGGGRRKDDNH
ncbi:uncharacterized protein LOC134768557 [Penaeus indicus]|uniref:uncharacterized protein LOC134768557 n=1 Tax=Penaeus indicus TaxID=29960 RepID=UPI00300D119F